MEFIRRNYLVLFTLIFLGFLSCSKEYRYNSRLAGTWALTSIQSDSAEIALTSEQELTRWTFMECANRDSFCDAILEVGTSTEEAFQYNVNNVASRIEFIELKQSIAITYDPITFDVIDRDTSEVLDTVSYEIVQLKSNTMSLRFQDADSTTYTYNYAK